MPLMIVPARVVTPRFGLYDKAGSHLDIAHANFLPVLWTLRSCSYSSIRYLYILKY